MLVDRAIASDATFARAHAARGNILVRSGAVVDAFASYERAAQLAPGDGATRYAMAELAFLMNDFRAPQMFADAFARERLYEPVAMPGARRALVLGLAGQWPRNIPLDFVMDDRRWSRVRWFLPDPDAATRALPEVDLIVNALGAYNAGTEALDQAEAIVAAHGLPSINATDRIRAIARDRLVETLAGVPGVRVPRTARVDADALVGDADGCAGIVYPLLVRPVDSHGGRGLERVASAAELAKYRAAHLAPVYDLSAYVEYRSADGWFRKYRIIAVDGEPFAYHLAIDEHWMIHYYRTPTAVTPWMTEEEIRFTSDPASALAGWSDAVPALFGRLGLDYVGIDCAQLADGTLLVFEADTAMLVHAFDTSPAAAAKRAVVDRIRAALCNLFDARSDV